MKFTLSWLKRHLDTSASLEEIVETMIRIGLEVEHVLDPAERLRDVTVAEIIRAAPHPDADKLKICDVKTKDGDLQIVCGASNARAGIKVAFAPVGTYIPGIDTTLGKAKIRGVESAGMMCSARELEVGDDHEGIIEAPQNAPIGAPYLPLIGADDPVIDFEVTPNRPDTNGVMGVARDLAAAGLGVLKSDRFASRKTGIACIQNIELDFPEDKRNACPVFGGVLITGLENGPSPQWLQHLLLAVGLRPISALVDITNFVSLDRARPLHVYDADKVTGPIRARMGLPGESFEALDGKTYQMTGTECVIADDARVLGFGGIMGGNHSGSQLDTKNVFVECAWFDPVITARTGRDHAIQSDARYRFERGVDPASIEEGLAQAVAMILEYCGGRASDPLIAGQTPDAPAAIAFPPSEVLRLTGLKLAEDEMAAILSALGFEITRDKTPWQVIPPSARPDIAGKADLVEEIARIKGFDAIQSLTLPRLDAPLHSDDAIDRERLTRRALTQNGLMEAVTFSFCDTAEAALFVDGDRPLLTLANPISSTLEAMRPSILPGLIAAARRNIAHGREDIHLFEIGPVYRGEKPEDQVLSIAGLRRASPPRHWHHAQAGAQLVDIFTVKADCETALSAAGVAVDNLMLMPMPSSGRALPHYHPGRSGVFSLGPKRPLAWFGELHPRIAKRMDIDGHCYIFEIDLSAIPASRKKPGKTRQAPVKYDLLPVTRDFAFVVEERVTAEEVLKAARRADKKMITRARLFDVYQGKGVSDGKKSLAIEITLQPVGKTLTDEEIEAIGEKIISQVTKATGGQLRA